MARAWPWMCSCSARSSVKARHLGPNQLAPFWRTLQGLSPLFVWQVQLLYWHSCVSSNAGSEQSGSMVCYLILRHTVRVWSSGKNCVLTILKQWSSVLQEAPQQSTNLRIGATSDLLCRERGLAHSPTLCCRAWTSWDHC